jgi:fatty acid desaturase 1 (delta-5 desaturase)
LLKATAEKMGLFDKNVTFFLLQFFQVVILDILAWATLYYFGCNWTTYILAIIFLTTAQVKIGNRFFSKDLSTKDN